MIRVHVLFSLNMALDFSRLLGSLWVTTGFPMKHLLAFCFVFLLAQHMAQAADISIVAEEAPDHPPVILIKGQFKNEEIQKDISTFSALSGYYRKPSIVCLDSPGGQIWTAIQIGLIIKRLGFSTAVADSTLCSSASALIWISGKEKFMGKNARIGFHAPKVTDKPEASHSGLAIVALARPS